MKYSNILPFDQRYVYICDIDFNVGNITIMREQFSKDCNF